MPLESKALYKVESTHKCVCNFQRINYDVSVKISGKFSECHWEAQKLGLNLC